MYFSGYNNITIKPLFYDIRNNFTYELWVKPAASHIITTTEIKGTAGLSGQRYVIGPVTTEDDNSAGMGLSVGTNGVSVFEHSNYYLPSLLTYENSITSWTHIALVYENKRPNLYINGEFIKKGKCSPKVDVYASGLIGGHEYGSFIGEVREVRLWDHSRTEEQIKFDYKNKPLGVTNGLFGYWEFQDYLVISDNQENQKIHSINKINPKVSCILTSYNRPYKVQEAIASILTQSYSNWELIIVDDNSNEYTQKILKEMVKQDDRLILIQSGVRDHERAKTARYATCINMALPLIKGDLVTYLTDDDIYYPHRFEKMVEVFTQNTNIYVVYGKQKVVYFSRERRISAGIRPLVGVTRSPMNKVDHNSFMHRTLCLDVVKGWDDDPSLWIAADAEFFAKLVKYWDFHPIDVITDEHRVHDDGVQSMISNGRLPWERG